MLFFKDNKDGYYEFEDDAPKEWYKNLTPCEQQLPNKLSTGEIEAKKNARALDIMSSPALEAIVEEFTAVLKSASISVPKNLMSKIITNVKGKLP